MVLLCLDEALHCCVNIYPKVIGCLNIIDNIPGIFLKKPGKIMEISWNFVSPEMWEPWTEQHSEHLLRGGWCASCVHAGGLSCCLMCLQLQTHVRQILNNN